MKLEDLTTEQLMELKKKLEYKLDEIKKVLYVKVNEPLKPRNHA